MANYTVTDTELTNIADAIIAKAGLSGQLEFPTDFVSGISGISTGTDVSDTTATASDVRTGKYFYTSAGVKTQGSIANGSATTPATTITANPTISVSNSGLITATNSKTQSVTPTVSAGYVSSGTAGTITVSGSNTSQLTTQAGSTIAPTESVQTAVASGKYTTGDVKIGAISSTYVGSGIDRNDSTDLSASGDTVTVPAGYYASQATKAVSAGSTTQNAPTVDGSGLVTATATVTAGYQGASTKSNTLQLTSQAAQTIHPSTTDQTITSGKYLTGTQTVKGVLLTNLDAGNIKKDVVVKVGDSTDDDCVTSVTGTYEGSGGGGDDKAHEIIARTISGTYENSKITIAGTHAFASCTNLVSVNFQNCTSISVNTFASCTKLVGATFENCTSINSQAFYNCQKLAVISFPKCTYISVSAFVSCKALTSIEFPKCKTISTSAFFNCASIGSASFAVLGTMGNHAFRACYKLLSLYLLGSSVVNLVNISALTSTPIAGYTTSTAGVYGSIYVPASLYNTYKTATNWVTYADRFVSV